MKRLLKIVKTDGTEESLALSKVTAIHDPEGKMSVLIHLDRLADGTWRLTYNKSHIPDFTAIERLELIRD